MEAEGWASVTHDDAVNILFDGMEIEMARLGAEGTYGLCLARHGILDLTPDPLTLRTV